MATQHLKLHPITGNTDHDTTGLVNGQLLYVQNPTNGVQSTGLSTNGTGGLTATTFSATTISGGTIFSGSTNLYAIFSTIGSSGGVNNVNAGSNITTGGTAASPIINLTASPSVNNITFSGTAIGGTVQAGAGTFTSLSAGTLSGGTILSGSTNLYSIFTTGPHTQVQPGSNITTGGTTALPTVNLVASPSVNNITFSGTAIGGNVQAAAVTATSLSAATLSGGTILSGSTNLYAIFATAGSGVQAVQPGSNITTGGTTALPTVSLVASPSVNNITFSGTAIGGTVQAGAGTFTSLSANTLSGGTILSGSTNLYAIFATAGSGVQAVQPGSNITTGGTLALPVINLTASPSVNNLTVSGTANVTGALQSGGTNLNNIYIQGSGTSGTIPVWTGTRLQSNSVITQAGTGVTVMGSIYIYGNVDVLGTASTFNTQTIQTADNNITMNLSGSHVSAFGGGINVLSGTPANTPSSWTIDSNGAWSANTQIFTSAITVNGGAIISGATNLYQIFATAGSGVQAVVAGTNITTGGTASIPIINLTASPSVNNITFSGTAIGGTVQAGAGTFTSLSAGTLSGGTILSGSTNLYAIFTTGPHTQVQPGSNITTGGTTALPTVNLVASPSVNNITFSGTAIGGAGQFAAVTATSLSAGTLSGGTILSGSTNLYAIFATTGQDFTTASNGLTKSNYNVTLGGTLTAATTVVLGGNALQLSGEGASSTTVAWSGAPYYTRLLVNGSGSQLKTTFGTLGNNFFLASDTMTMNFTDGGTGNQMIMKFDGTNMFVTDSVNSRGLEYVTDYSANFLTNSLVTKKYVDNAITGITSAITTTLVQPGSNITTGGTSALPVVSLVASPSINNLTVSGSTTAQGISGTTIYASQFFQMTPYTGANPTSTNNNDVWFYSAATGIITLNYKVGGVVKGVELS